MSAAPKSYAATLEELRAICANVCRPEVHEAMKLDPRWSLLPLVRRLDQPADEYGPAETIEVRNCGCKSSLQRTIVAPA